MVPVLHASSDSIPSPFVDFTVKNWDKESPSKTSLKSNLLDHKSTAIVSLFLPFFLSNVAVQQIRELERGKIEESLIIHPTFLLLLFSTGTCSDRGTFHILFFFSFRRRCFVTRRLAERASDRGSRVKNNMAARTLNHFKRAIIVSVQLPSIYLGRRCCRIPA